MTDLELLKEIMRAVSGVPAEDAEVSAAVAKVRALFAAPEREEKSSHDRQHRGGRTRSDG